MSKVLDISNKRFGSLIALQMVGTDRHNKAIWECVCDCGNKIEAISNQLMVGDIRSCGCLRSPNLVGKRVGKLTVLSLAPKKSLKTHWYCKCDCGRVVSITATKLIRETIGSCGCECTTEKYPPGLAFLKSLIRQYKKKGEERNKIWFLSDEQATKLFRGNCYYCGKEPSQVFGAGRAKGKFVYNGIDRMDNSIGYVAKNCVSCCKFCNWSKNKLSHDEFIALCQKVAKIHPELSMVA